MGSIGESEEVWEALEQVSMAAAEKGELPIRVFAMVPLPTWYRSESSHLPNIASSPQQHIIKPLPEPTRRRSVPLPPQPVCVVIVTHGWVEEDVGKHAVSVLTGMCIPNSAGTEGIV